MYKVLEQRYEQMIKEKSIINVHINKHFKDILITVFQYISAKESLLNILNP